MNASQYRAQTNAWNNHVSYAKKANDQFVGASTKARFVKMAEIAYGEYIQAGGTNSKTSMFII